MQRTATVLLTSLLAGLLMTGCPEKKVEKEEPAAREPSAVDKSGADEKADDEHGGQLAAGVAHEINNPIGYVRSNLTTLRSSLCSPRPTTTGSMRSS